MTSAPPVFLLRMFGENHAWEVALNDQPAQDAAEQEEDEKRRRLLLWLLLGAALLLLLLLLTLCSRQGGDVAAVSTTSTTQAPATTPSTTGPPVTTSEPPTTEPPTTTTAPPATTTTLVPTLDGTWSFVVDVTVSTGACRGENKEKPYTRLVTIAQDGGTLSVVGLGNPADTQVWVGSIEDKKVTVGGEREEDDGRTTADFTLLVDFEAGTMAGIEEWSWRGPGGSCPDSMSDVTATKIG